jgi:hypothetical protein
VFEPVLLVASTSTTISPATTPLTDVEADVELPVLEFEVRIGLL